MSSSNKQPLTPNTAILLGSLYMLFAALSFSLMGFLARMVSPRIPGTESVFIRGATNAAILIPFMYSKGINLLGTNRRDLLCRGVIGTLAAFCYFLSVTLAPLAEATALFRTTALFMPFLAVILLGEKFSWLRCFYALIGFFGACLVLKPGFSVVGTGLWIATIGAFLNALAWASVRHLSQREHPATITLYFCVCSFIGSFLWDHNSFVLPNSDEWSLLIAMSLAGLAGQVFLTLSYLHAEASLVTPIGYAEILGMVILGWIFLDQIPDLISAGGIFLIILAGVLVVRNRFSPR